MDINKLLTRWGFLFLLVVTGCSAPFEKMDVERFLANKDKSHRYRIEIEGVDQCWQKQYFWQDTIYYKEYRIYKEQKRGEFTTFYPDGTVHSKGNCFYLQEYEPIGIQTFYDKRGKVIRKIDWDQYYPFSFEDVVEWLKNEGWDISEENTIDEYLVLINRSGAVTYPKYEIRIFYILPGIVEHLYRHILIDGISGEVKQDHLHFLPEVNRWRIHSEG